MGLKGIELAKLRSDVTVMDIVMPEMNGMMQLWPSSRNGLKPRCNCHLLLGQ